VRKRVVIVALAVVIGGGIAQVVFKPSEDPIEYHKRKFFAALHGKGWTQQIRNFCYQSLGKTFSVADERRLERHHKALRDLGYLEKREYVFTNRTTSEVLNAIMNFWPPGIDPTHRHFYDFEIPANTNANVFRILMVRGDAQKWEPVMRFIDSKDWRSLAADAVGLGTQ
jgi:hypothetical protein